MSLQGDLKELEAAQHAEVLYLHRTYLRTKREIKREVREAKRGVQRALSPGRMIRKHPVAAIGVGALLGFLVAPSGSNKTKVEVSPKPEHKGGGISGKLRHVMRMMKHVVPGLSGRTASKPATGPKGAAAGAPSEEHSWPAMLEGMIVSLMGALNFDHVLGSWARHLAEKMKNRASRHHEGNGRHPPAAEEGTGATGPAADRFDFGQG